jgi:hypothetical protein
MLAGRRIAFLTALCAIVLAACAGGPAGAAEDAPPDRYWLGPYFAGLRLTHTGESPGTESTPPDKSFSYGDCELPEGEGGCSLPVDVQNWSSCYRNPIGLDRLPLKVFLVRGGGLAAQYESTGVDIGTGNRTVTIFADYELVGAAIRELRTEADAEPQPLAPPVYPMPVLRELKRATTKPGELRPEEVKVRLRIAKLLGPDALADVPPPTMSVETVERLRQLSFRAAFNIAKTARENGLTKAELRRKVKRVRGLAGFC